MPLDLIPAVADGALALTLAAGPQGATLALAARDGYDVRPSRKEIRSRPSPARAGEEEEGRIESRVQHKKER